jgi:tRNA-dihydrouridine synthase C
MTEPSVTYGEPARFALAPMEGLLNAQLRQTLTGAAPYDWCVTEFVRVTQTLLPLRTYLRLAPELQTGSQTASGVPVQVQLLGSDPVCMAENAAHLLELNPAGIDINFGCPAPIVNRHGGGAILLDEPAQLDKIVCAMTRAVDGRAPVTAKMRLGVHDKSRALEAAHALAGAGAELLVVHARTKDEGYRPPAHWEWVARIAEAVNVPVIANGEIWSVEDYMKCRAVSGQRAVMVGRGAIADPFLVERIQDRLAGREVSAPARDWGRVVKLVLEYWDSTRKDAKARHAPGRIKQWLNQLRRTFPQAEEVFQKLKRVREPHAFDVQLRSLLTVLEPALLEGANN